MSQNDFDLANQVGASFRADVNAAFQALASGNSGASRPSTAYAGQCWIDTDYGTDQWGIYRIVDPADAALDVLESIINTATGQRRLPANMTTAIATATQYANIATYSYPSGSPAGDNLAAKATLLLTPTEDGGNYKPILIEVNAKQGSGGLDTTNSYIHVIRNAGDAVQYDAFDLTTTAATNGTDIKLHMQSDIAAKYAVQVITEELDPGVSSEYHDGATWAADNPLTTPAPAASVTSDWSGSGTYVPVIYGATVAGAGTYSVQNGAYSLAGGRCRGKAVLAWSAHTGTGAMFLSLPVTPTGTFNACSVYYNGLTVGSGKQLSAIVDPAGYISFSANDPPGGSANTITIDSAVTYLIVNFDYEA